VSARAWGLVLALPLGLLACFKADDAGDELASGSESTGASSESESSTGSTSESTSESTTTSESTSESESTTTSETTSEGESTTTSAGETGPGGCMSATDCGPTEYCDFADDQCGDLGSGTCMPRPTECGNGFEVTGCDCNVYPGSCEAAMAGTDFKCIGICC
jgi:hypothetical protein